MSKNVKRLFGDFQPSNYKITLAPDANAMTFTGTVIIEGKKVGRPSQRLTLHQKDLKITSAKLKKYGKDASEIEIDRINTHSAYDEVRFHSKSQIYPGQYSITIEFSGKINDQMHGLYPCYFEHEGKKKKLLATQFESHHAREVFPCVDEPEAKATFDLTLLTPPDETVLSNTPIKSSAKNGNLTETTFETTPKMSTYLLAFVTGELRKVSGKTKENVEVNIWATLAQPLKDLEFSLDTAIRCIEFFDGYFDTNYPLTKCDHVALPDFSSAAMENWGLITYRESVLVVDSESSGISTKQRTAEVIAHETSHQWFGNLVTMKWWDDLWLNESFANMMAYVAVDDLYPEWNIWTDFASHESLMALRRDSLPGVQAVKIDVSHPDEISALFDPSIVYAKGGQLLNMLRTYIGEEAFRKGLQQYFKDHAYGNTTGDDLWKSLGKTSGKDVNTFMTSWLEKSGFPVISAELEGDELTLTQSHFLIGDKPDATKSWPVPLCADNKDIPETLDTKSIKVKVSDASIKLNRDDKSYYIADYDQTLQDKLIDKIAKQELGEIDRLQILSEAGLLSRGLVKPAADLITLLDAYKNETSQPVWDIISMTIGDLKRFTQDSDKAEADLKRFAGKLAQNLYDELGWESKADEPEQTAKLRAGMVGTMIYAEDKDAIKTAIDKYTAVKDIAKLDGEMRVSILVATVRHGDKTNVVEELIAYHRQTNSGELKDDICASLTSSKDIEVGKELLAFMRNGKDVRMQDLAHWLVYMIRNRHFRVMTWEWLKDNWDWIEKMYAGDKSFDYFPRYVAGAFGTKAELKEYVTFFGPKKSDMSIRRPIEVGISEIKARIEWLETNKAEVVARLSSI